ncbi:MAG: hypothetical protein WB771_03125 [Solirubrobacterales bacterium]
MSEAPIARGADPTALRSRALAQPGTVLAGAAMLFSGILLLHWLGRLTFWRDEWDFLLHRRSWSPGTFLHPFAEQLLAIPTLIYRALVTTFGMESAVPWQVTSVVLFLLSVGLLFVYVRRRAGEWLALAAILPILFLGSSWDDLLFPFQMALFGSIACGIGALLALDRSDRAGDRAAMVLLILALLFFDLGIPFVAAVTAELALSRDRWRRAFVVIVPTALWLLWYAGWGHNAHTFISAHNFANAPAYVLDGLSTSLASFVGLGLAAGGYQVTPLEWGRPLLVLVAILAAFRIRRLGRPSGRLVAVSVLLLGFWFLTALNTNPLAPATAGRYQYIGIILIVLVAAELVRGLRLGRWMTVGLLIVAVSAAVANGTRLNDAAGGLATIAKRERGGLAALELARGRVAPSFKLTEQNSGVDYLGVLDAGSYFSAIDAYGSPAYTPDELATAADLARVSADEVSAAALGVGLTPAPAARGGQCLPPRPNIPITVPPSGLLLRAATPGIQASLRRYAKSSFPVSLGELRAGLQELLLITPDRSSTPWLLQLSGPRVSVCRRLGA